MSAVAEPPVVAEETVREEEAQADAIERMDEVFGPRAYAFRVEKTETGRARITVVRGENPNDPAAEAMTGAVLCEPRLAAPFVNQVYADSSVSEPEHISADLFGEPDESAERAELIPVAEKVIAAKKAGKADGETGEVVG